MMPLVDRLQQHYSRHYVRMNGGVRDRRPTMRQLRAFERTYGRLVHNLPPGSEVADVGCGTGHFLVWLSQASHLRLTGVDLLSSQLETAAELCPQVTFHCQDGQSFLASRPNALAGVFCFDVLEHLTDSQLAAWMDSARSAIRPGGFVCCRCPNAANILGSYSRYLDLTHQRSFTRSSLLQLFESSGLVDCYAIPHRGGWWGASLRLTMEQWLHRGLYHLCGRRPEPIVTGNVTVVGFRPVEPAGGENHATPSQNGQASTPISSRAPRPLMPNSITD